MRPVHLRMARAALGWTLKELADKAGVNMNTISRYEAGAEILSGTMEKLEQVLRAEGVVFIDEDLEYHPSIRIRREVFPYPMIQAPDTRPFTIKTQISKTKPKGPRKPRR